MTVGSIAITVVGAIVALIVIVVVIQKLFSRDARLRRKVRAVRPRTIRDVPGGETSRVAGMVVAIGEPLIAPISGLPCVYY